MKLFTTRQIAAIDKYTIENEPIADIDLMERAAMQISNWLVQKFSTEVRLMFFAGPGNNGGDSLAIARQMAEFGYLCEVYLLPLGKVLQGSPATNWQRLENQGKVKLSRIGHPDDFPEIRPSDLLIDGLFGSGLTRPLQDLPAAVVHRMNECPNRVVSIDVPSGLMGEDNGSNIPANILKADYTLTFQFPKISFLFSENEPYTGKWEVLPIGLHPDGMTRVSSGFFMTEKTMVREIIPRRSVFAHKGNFGHALLIAGSYGKMGAAVLASRGCLHSGTGLLTTHVPRLGYSIIQSAVPEAMVSIDAHDSMFTGFPDLSPFSAVGAGPGLGMKHNSIRALHALIEQARGPLVLDADALNMLSENREWLEQLPENSILTPHPGEFRRLAGASSDSWERIQKQRAFAQKYRVVLVLKGAYTTVATPEGVVCFNSTGNPGMATAGSGDVLTGIILGLLAQQLPPYQAAVAGVFLHGRAGDLAAQEKSENALLAGDIIVSLGKAFLELKEE